MGEFSFGSNQFSNTDLTEDQSGSETIFVTTTRSQQDALLFTMNVSAQYSRTFRTQSTDNTLTIQTREKQTFCMTCKFCTLSAWLANFAVFHWLASLIAFGRSAFKTVQPNPGLYRSTVGATTICFVPTWVFESTSVPTPTTIKSSWFATSRLVSTFITLQWFKLVHNFIQRTSLHKGDDEVESISKFFLNIFSKIFFKKNNLLIDST